MVMRGGANSGSRTAVAGRLVWVLTALSLLVVGTSCSSPTARAQGHLGVFVGFNEGERLLQFEQDLGTPVDLVVTMADSRSPSDMNGSVYGQFAASDAYLPGLSDRLDVVLSVPIAFGPGGMARTEDGRETIGQNLRATADGRHDSDFRLVARYLVAAGYEDAIIRLAHEFDGDWAPYSARDNTDAFIAAFRHVHDVMTAESSAFRFDWTAMVPYFIEHGLVAYPGDDVVDMIGLDVYWRDPEPISDEVWERVYQPVLQTHLEFARERGKQVSYPEWGRSFADDASFVDLMHDWFVRLPSSGPGSLAYQAYFNEVGLANDEFYPYDLEQLPEVKRRYIELFGAD
jgi:hypothetical protein